MKVFEINTVCGYGSTGRIVNGIYDTLKARGDDCFVAYGRKEAPDGYAKICLDSAPEVYAHALLAKTVDMDGCGSRRATAKLIRKLEEYQPDVIHLHNLHGYYLNIKMLFRYLAEKEIPVVWTLHDCWSFTGTCFHFEYIGCDRWKSHCHDCPKRQHGLCRDGSKEMFTLKKDLFTGVKNMTVVTPSQWLADLAKQSYLSKYPVRVIHNGIRLSDFKPTPCTRDFGGKRVVLGVASVWTPTKGLDTLIRLADSLGEAYQVVVVGLNDRQLKALPDSVMGIKRTNSIQELAELYSAADVFVNPTMADNYPTTNLEALACGTQVITYRTGGSPESVDETCGAVVAQGDEEALRAEIIRLCDAPRSAEACLNRARSFDQADRFGEYADLFRDLVK